MLMASLSPWSQSLSAFVVVVVVEVVVVGAGIASVALQKRL